MRGYMLRRLQPRAPEIIARYQDGAAFDELAALYGCSPGTIRRLMLSNDVPVRPCSHTRRVGAA